ncbi:MAG: type II toxin-antitoxin system VapC family toxin [Acidimicrobiales bacterium]
MRLYLDSSALVKLVKMEPESGALLGFLRRRRTDGRVTSALARVEVVRAVAAGGSAAVAQARRLLARVDQVNIDRTLLDEAATLAPGSMLRSLDAIHLASARLIGADLRAVVTYDPRMADAADALSFVVEAPA